MIVTLSQTTPNPPLQFDTSDVKLRCWYGASFIAGDGVTPIEGGNGQTGFFYEIDCTQSVSGNVVIPTFDMQATTESNPTADFFAQLYVNGAPNQMIIPNTPGAGGWAIPTVYGAVFNFGELALYNRAKRLVYQSNNVFTADETIREILLLAAGQNYAGVGILGRTQLSYPPLVASVPIALSEDDPRVSGLQFNIVTYGASTLGTAAANATAIAAAVTAANLLGGAIVVPLGTFTTNSVTISAPVVFVGAGSILSPATGQTVTITKGIVADVSKHFNNALSGQGTVSITSPFVQEIPVEWWGAVAGGVAATNTTAIQAAIIGAYGSARTNASGLFIYNRILKFSGMYDISDELHCYHMLGFQWIGEQQLASGLRQNTTNKRIIDGQSVAYGTFRNLMFQGGIASNKPLIDIDYDGSQGSDLRPQNITFYDCVVQGQTYSSSILPTNFIGVHLCKSGAGAQGDNIRFYNCYVNGFSEAGVQLGTALAFAQNAIDVQFIGGDIQACPKHALAAYGGNFIVAYTTLENGNVTSADGVGQTDYELFASGSVITNVVSHVRSESMKFAWGNWEIEDCSVLGPQVTYNTTWPNQPGAASFTNQLVTGTPYGGDGIMYLVSNVGVYGGLVSTTATGGSLTTVVKAGAGWTVNAFAGQRVTIMSGSGKYQYGVIGSNTATTLTCPAGFVSNYALRADTGLPVAITAPDATSVFVIEPDWNAGAITSGTVNMTALSVNALDGDTAFQGTVDNFNAGYGTRLRIAGASDLPQRLSRIMVTRSDWLTSNTNLLDNTYASVQLSSIQVRRPNAIADENCVWIVPRNGYAATFSDYSQNQRGNEWNIWSRGDVGGGTAWSDLGIGRGDGIANNDVNAASRNVLGYLGMLGRKTPSGTNLAGTATQIQGGLSTGSGAPGAIELWIAAAGSTGVAINVGAKKTYLDANGLHIPAALNYPPLAPAQITSNQNDYNPGAPTPYLRLITDVSRDVTGLTFTPTQADGQVITIINIGLANLRLMHQNVGSAAANRFYNSTAADITLTPKQAADVIYDTTNQYWLVYKRN